MTSSEERRGAVGSPSWLELLTKLGCNLKQRGEGEIERERGWKRERGKRQIQRVREGKREGGRKRKQQRERERERVWCQTSWAQKVNRAPDCSMLSAVRGLQLGESHGGTPTLPHTGTHHSPGTRGSSLFITLFILISLYQGLAWPYGKSPCKIRYVSLSLSTLPPVFISPSLFLLKGRKAFRVPCERRAIQWDVK